jgi:predicted neuraminidase
MTYISLKPWKNTPLKNGESLLRRWDKRKLELIGQARGTDLMAKGKMKNQNGEMVDTQLGYPRFRRMGWQTQNKPLFLPSGRMIVPLYSDGFDFSLMAITDNGGKNWIYSEPLVSLGGVQPTLVQRKDGTIVTYMRDNGPPPQRLLTSTSEDEGITWAPVTDSEIPNPGAGSDIVKLSDGRWLLANNDTENDRNSLALYLSADEGKNWRILFHLERDLREGSDIRAHYPAIIQGKNGDIHLTYSYYERDAEGKRVETIRYARVALNSLSAP